MTLGYMCMFEMTLDHFKLYEQHISIIINLYLI